MCRASPARAGAGHAPGIRLAPTWINEPQDRPVGSGQRGRDRRRCGVASRLAARGERGRRRAARAAGRGRRRRRVLGPTDWPRRAIAAARCVRMWPRHEHALCERRLRALRGRRLPLRRTRPGRLHAIGTRCRLTGTCTHDRLRSSFTPAPRQRLHQAARSRGIAPCPLPRPPRSVSRRRPSCSSCEPPALTSRAWSRRFRAISSPSSWCPSRAWTPGSGGSRRSGVRSAPGWPSGESRSTESSGGRRPPVVAVRLPALTHRFPDGPRRPPRTGPFEARRAQGLCVSAGSESWPPRPRGPRATARRRRDRPAHRPPPARAARRRARAA